MANSARKNTVCITGCDTYLGSSIACHFLKQSEHEGRGQGKIRVTTKDRRCCEKLKEMGAEVYEINFDREETMCEAFKDCDNVVLIPELSKKCYQDTERMIKAMEREGVRNVLLQSAVGADTNDRDLQRLHEIGKIERSLEERLGQKGDTCICIFRNAFVQQCFLLWAPMIERERCLRLNSGENGRFSPVDMCDIACATYDILCGERKNRGQGFQLVPMDRRHHKQRYMITGPDAMDGRGIVNQMNEAFRENREIRFEPVDRREVKKYLESLRKDHLFAKLSAEQERNLGKLMQEVLPNVAGGPGSQRRREGKDRYHGSPRFEHLTEVKIELICDMLEHARHGRSDFVSGDLEKIIDDEPENMRDFFRRYRDEFEHGGSRV